jgi:YspA, cpYpsA-related SLOG family
MERPRILVCGGRDFTDYQFLANELDKIVFNREWIISSDDGNWLANVIVIHGGAKGADSCADRWAVSNWTGLEIYKADWYKYGKRAGPIRNQIMLNKGKPDLVVAFPTPSSRGTWDMVRRSQKKKIETIVINGPKPENPQ